MAGLTPNYGGIDLGFMDTPLNRNTTVNRQSNIETSPSVETPDIPMSKMPTQEPKIDTANLKQDPSMMSQVPQQSLKVDLKRKQLDMQTQLDQSQNIGYTPGPAPSLMDNEVFMTPEYQAELDTKPYLKEAWAELDQGRNYDAAFRDIVNGMTEEELTTNYGDIDVNQQRSLLGLAADIQAGMPVSELQMYSDLPRPFLKKLLKDKDLAKMWHGRAFSDKRESKFEYPTLITEDNLADMDIWERLKGNQKISESGWEASGNKEDTTLSFLGNEAHLGLAARLVGNIPAGFRTMMSFMGNFFTDPEVVIKDMANGIAQGAKGVRQTASTEGAAGAITTVNQLADLVVTNPELVYGGQFTKMMKQGAGKIFNIADQALTQGAASITKTSGPGQTSQYKGSPLHAYATDYILGKTKTKVASYYNKGKIPKNFKDLTSKQQADVRSQASYDVYKDVYGKYPEGFKVPYANEGRTIDTTPYQAPQAPGHVPGTATSTMKASPFNQGVNAEGMATIRPVVRRTKTIDSFIDQGTANTIKNLKNDAGRVKVYEDHIEGAQTLLENKDVIPYIFDEAGNPTTSTIQYTAVSQAIAETKTDIWNLVEPMVDEATNAGATVDVAPLVESIQTSMQGSVLSDGTMIPGAESAYSTMNKYLNMLIDENGTSKTMSVSDAQRISQSINRQTKALYNGGGGDILTNIALEGINRQLRPAIDTAVEKVLDTPGLKDLKKRRGSLTNIEPSITKRGQVIDRQPKAGLFGGLSDIYGGAELGGAVANFAMGNIGGGISGLIKAGSVKLINKYIKNKNDRNRALAKMFMEVDKQMKGYKIPGGYRGIKIKPKTRPTATEGTPKLETETVMKATEVKLNRAEKLKARAAKEKVIAKNKVVDKAKFDEVKKNGTEIEDSNTWKEGDISELGTLESGIILEGRIRKVKIDGELILEGDAEPVYRLSKADIKKTKADALDTFTKEMEEGSLATKKGEGKIDLKEQKIGAGRNMAMEAILKEYGIKSIEDLPNDVAMKVIEAARSRSTKMEAEIDELLTPYKKTSNTKAEAIKKTNSPMDLETGKPKPTTNKVEGLETKRGLFGGEEANNKGIDIPADTAKALRAEKGLSADDIMKKYPDIQLKRDVPVKDINELSLDKSMKLATEVKGLGSVFAEGPGYYFTDSISEAQGYGDSIIELDIKKGTNLLEKTSPKLTDKQIDDILGSFDKEILDDAGSDRSENYDDGINQIKDMIKKKDNPLDQLIDIRAEILHRQDPEKFVKAMKDNGIDGIVIKKDGSNHYILYNTSAFESINNTK